jgi:predicted nucleotide-binding protein (sugar kinase/HSP70/actin superfamily)
MGNYHVAIKPIAQLLADEVVVPPPITRRTLELGSRYSPESVCVPFKYNLGNFIESLEKGANIIIQAGGGCRFGYYGEVQKEILKKLGYEFEFIKLNNNYSILTEIVNIKKKYNPSLSYYKIGKTLLLSYQRLRAIDTIEETIRKNIGFEKNKGGHEALHKQFLSELDKTTTMWQARSCKKKYAEVFNKIELEKPDDYLKVGLV